jgi:branched-chain amino acid transport system permease protein
VIVASLGCVLVIQEFIRIVISARNFNLPPIWQFSVPLLRGDHFVVRLHGFDMLAIGGAVLVAGILVWIMGKTTFGRNWRAISQDRLGAALCGVSLSRTESQSFVLAGFLCGLTGAMLALRYGVINFHSGTGNRTDARCVAGRVIDRFDRNIMVGIFRRGLSRCGGFRASGGDPRAAPSGDFGDK